jgi:hypothetical protein
MRDRFFCPEDNTVACLASIVPEVMVEASLVDGSGLKQPGCVQRSVRARPSAWRSALF